MREKCRERGLSEVVLNCQIRIFPSEQSAAASKTEKPGSEIVKDGFERGEKSRFEAVFFKEKNKWGCGW